MTDEAVPDSLPTLDRDVLKLLFRNILAQKAVRNTAGTIISKLAATNKICLNAIGHVTNRFRTSIITSHGMTLVWDDQDLAIAVTPAQFVWLVQWDMLHLKDIAIASRNAREWRALIENFHFPSLEMLEYAVPLHKPRKLTDDSSVDLAADIVKLNASSLKELHGVPVWQLPEPLPALRLKLFMWEPQREDDDLSNLSVCVIDELRVNLEHCSPEEEISLDALDEVNVKKIVFHGDCGYLPDFTASEGRTNEHVRHVQFKLATVFLEDIEIMHDFLPSLTSVQINTAFYIGGRHHVIDLLQLQRIGQYLASDPSMPSLKGHVSLSFTEYRSEALSWTAENVRDEYAKVQEARDAIAEVPPQLTVRAVVYANFHRAGDAETKEADKLASKLGFASRSFVMSYRPYGRRVDYANKLELGPGRELCMQCTVYDRSQ